MSKLLSMSDAEVAALSEEEIEAIVAEDETVVTTPEDVDSNDPREDSAPAQVVEEPAVEEEEEVTTEEPIAEESSEEDPVEEEPSEEEKPDPVEEVEEPVEESKEEDKTKPYDYKKQVERILSPIKANGRQIQVESVDDAIQLMQMGANYHKKMESLKPGLSTLKLLEQHGLLDQEKLAHLIDLSRGDVNAVNRLIKDKGIDTLALDAEKGSEYKAGHYTVDESAVVLEQVLDDLRDSPKYTDMLNVVGNKWDNASQNELSKNPEHLRAITAHMEAGIYDLVEDRVFTERALGRLRGLSDFDAYRTVGERMAQEGKFNSAAKETVATTNTPPKVTKVISTSKAVSEAAKKDQKRAASSSVKQAVTKPVTDYNPLSMSDEEFIKLSQANFNTF